MKASQPAALLPEHLDYLGYLRESGVCNMFGAAMYLQAEFPELYKEESREILVYWMKMFKERLG